MLRFGQPLAEHPLVAATEEDREFPGAPHGVQYLRIDCLRARDGCQLLQQRGRSEPIAPALTAMELTVAVEQDEGAFAVARLTEYQRREREVASLQLRVRDGLDASLLCRLAIGALGRIIRDRARGNGRGPSPCQQPTENYS